MEHSILYLFPIFIAVAFIYSSVGLGGGSSYLAVLALFGVPYQNIPSIALGCNIVVTAGVIYHFFRAGHLRLKLILPFVITSIPMNFIGAGFKLSEATFNMVLAAVLILAAFRLFFWKARNKASSDIPATIFIFGPLVGAALGFLAGVVGIGGGIFLLPVIVFFGWGKVKEGAMAAGTFTFLNSVSGFIAHGVKGAIDWQLLLPLLIAVIIGGQIGARLGAKRLSPATVQRIFALILFMVAIKLVC